MQLQSMLLAILFILSLTSCKAQSQTELFTIQIPSIEQEASTVWRTINDIEFLEGQGYNIHLPKHPLIDNLIQKSKNGQFGNDDYPSIYQLLESEIYRKDAYQLSLAKVVAQKTLIQDMLAKLNTTHPNWEWGFKVYQPYEIVLTLYGTGGGYDPETGRVTLFTNQEGRFMKYQNPAYTIIHEIIHIGIEYPIIQTYQVSHGNKERIVDTIVSLLFQDVLAGYQIQEMGNPALDQELKSVADIERLPQIVKRIKR
ncbi:MAG: hypothetical protein AAFQ68_04105 [Bacteroidota bacterium]